MRSSASAGLLESQSDETSGEQSVHLRNQRGLKAGSVFSEDDLCKKEPTGTDIRCEPSSEVPDSPSQILPHATNNRRGEEEAEAAQAAEGEAMIQLPIYDKAGKQVETLSIDEQTLGGEVRFAVLKQAYVAVHTNQRQGSARTKSRGDIVGSTRKIYKQKGTGNARAGASRTPTRKGGGVCFKKDRTREAFRSELPKKMRRLANRNALLAKLVDGEVKCFLDLNFAAPKTSDFVTLLATVGINRTTLIALDRANRNAQLSARNIEGVDTCRVDQLNVFELLNHRFLVLDKAALVSFLDESCFEHSESGRNNPAKETA